MSTEGSGASRAGGDGVHNEDAFLVDQGHGLYVVCDGVSASPAGEAAARVAANAIEEMIERSGEDLASSSERAALAVVEKAMLHALDSLADAERSEPELSGFATTVTMLLVVGRLGVIGHRGDSRAYLIRRDRAHPLTVDHALTGAATDNDARPDFDVFKVDLRDGDTLVLCTDGAEDVVQDDNIVRAVGALAPQIVASRIVSAANRRAPDQDATAVVVRVRRDREPGWLELSAAPRGTSFGHTLSPLEPVEPPPLLDRRKVRSSR